MTDYNRDILVINWLKTHHKFIPKCGMINKSTISGNILIGRSVFLLLTVHTCPLRSMRNGYGTICSCYVYYTFASGASNTEPQNANNNLELNKYAEQTEK